MNGFTCINNVALVPWKQWKGNRWLPASHFCGFHTDSQCEQEIGKTKSENQNEGILFSKENKRVFSVYSFQSSAEPLSFQMICCRLTMEHYYASFIFLKKYISVCSLVAMTYIKTFIDLHNHLERLRQGRQGGSPCPRPPKKLYSWWKIPASHA